MPQPFFGTTQLPLDMRHVKTANVLEFDSFEQIPDAFLRIQFWGIRRETFKMNPLGTAFCQKVFDRLTAMNGCSIPDDQQFAGNLTGEHLQKANHIGTFVRMILRLHDDLSALRVIPPMAERWSRVSFTFKTGVLPTGA